MKKLFPILCLLFLTGCTQREYMKALKAVDSIVDVDARTAGALLDGMDKTAMKGKAAAYYAILRNQIDFRCHIPIESDSLAMVAVNYFGRRHSQFAAMSWQSLGQAYTGMKNVPSSINALLKALELFPDTTDIQYSRTRLILGGNYIDRGLYTDAVRVLELAGNAFEAAGDKEGKALAEYKKALAYQGLKRYEISGPAFLALKDNPALDMESRNGCNLQLAHISNSRSPSNEDAAREALVWADAYIAGCTSDSLKAVGYTEKGISWYYLNENDSSYSCLQKSFRLTVDPYTTSLNYYYISAVAVRMDLMRQALHYMRLYAANEKKIDEMGSRDEITQMRLQHAEEMQVQKSRALVGRVVLISAIVLILVIASLALISIQRERRREAYYIQLHDEFIRKQTREKEETAENGLQELCRHFRTGTAYSLIQDLQMQHRSMKAEERDVVIHDLNLYFADMIATLKAEAGKLNQQEICLLFCTALGIDQDMIADIICTSRSNMRSIKSRLKAKVQTSTFTMFFGE